MARRFSVRSMRAGRPCRNNALDLEHKVRCLVASVRHANKDKST